MPKTATSETTERQPERDLIMELEQLQAEVRARNPDLTPEEAESIAEQLTRDAIDQLVEQGNIIFARDR